MPVIFTFIFLVTINLMAGKKNWQNHNWLYALWMFMTAVIVYQCNSVDNVLCALKGPLDFQI